MPSAYYLTLSCENRPGIVAAVASQLFQAGGNILEAQQFDDVISSRFFMRVSFDFEHAIEEAVLRELLHPIASQYEMQWNLRLQSEKQRVLILVSKYDHCLVDLLYRQRIGELPMTVVGVISNHPKEVLNSTLLGDIPFHYLPVTPASKKQQEERIRTIAAETRAELIVLARYMQILSDDMASHLSGRCINIHHSFLPGFKGAKPYTQAFERGVKMIGATAHYVTGDLDEGPIIEQRAEAIRHSDLPDALERKGRDIERQVLARAVLNHLENRVLINGAKTVVFGE
jgi:formyltetrahydrofolate deformylase